MEDLSLSGSVIFPIVFYMFLGFCLKRLLQLKEETLQQMNKMVYSVFLPISMFRSVYYTDLSAMFDTKVVLYASTTLFIYFGILCWIVPKFEKEPTNCSVIIHGSFRSNHALFGLAVTTAIFGQENLGMTGVLSAVILILFNFLAVLNFEMFKKEKSDFKKICIKTAKGCAKNPLIIALVTGMVFLFIKIPIPGLLSDALGTLGSLATPLALIVLGASFWFDQLKLYARQLRFVALMRLIVIPVFFLIPAALLAGIRGVNLVVLMSMYASPTAVSSFPLAVAMGGNGKLAGLIVVITSIFSTVTVFLWIFILKRAGWIG